MIGLIAATANGRRNAAHLAQAWPDARLYDGRAREALDLAWVECDGIVLFLATGAAVRLIGPLLEGKHRDPGVVTVDDAARTTSPRASPTRSARRPYSPPRATPWAFRPWTLSERTSGFVWKRVPT